MTDNLTELIRRLQGKVIRFDFNRPKEINDAFADLQKIIPLLSQAYDEKGFPLDVAKELIVNFAKSIAANKPGLFNVVSFDESKKKISLAILDLQKTLSS